MENTPPPHRVAVLVLGFNHTKTILKTLESALTQSYDAYEVFYIDNASADCSVPLVREHFPNMRLFENTKNIGYAGAYHKTLTRVFREPFDTAVLLNPDTHVGFHWLSELVTSAYASPNIAFAQPKIYLWENGKTDIFNTAGNQVQFLGVGYCGRYQEKDIPCIENDIEIPYASGASLLVKKEVYEKLPGFDTSFFAYLEDQDLGWQARMLGYTNILSAKSVLWHEYDFHKKSLNHFKMYLLERNRLFFLLKNFETKTLFLIAPAFFVLEIGILFHSLLHGYFWKKILAYKDFLLALPKILKKRKYMQSIRTKTDRELFSQLAPTVQFAEVHSPLLALANKFFQWYYCKIMKNEK